MSHGHVTFSGIPSYRFSSLREREEHPTFAQEHDILCSSCSWRQDGWIRAGELLSCPKMFHLTAWFI